MRKHYGQGESRPLARDDGVCVKIMENQILSAKNIVTYTLRKSHRARRLRLTVRCDGSVIVTTPYNLNQNIIEKFVNSKAGWLLSKINYFKQFKNVPVVRRGKVDYKKNKAAAFVLIKEKVAKYNAYYGYQYNRLSIKNQKTRWGSCSKKGNLNFNYKILFLPEKIQNYIVVHELCHLKEFNHSRNFWNLVAQIIPDHLEMRRELRKRGIEYS